MYERLNITAKKKRKKQLNNNELPTEKSVAKELHIDSFNGQTDKNKIQFILMYNTINARIIIFWSSMANILLCELNYHDKIDKKLMSVWLTEFFFRLFIVNYE